MDYQYITLSNSIIPPPCLFRFPPTHGGPRPGRPGRAGRHRALRALRIAGRRAAVGGAAAWQDAAGARAGGEVSIGMG